MDDNKEDTVKFSIRKATSLFNLLLVAVPSIVGAITFFTPREDHDALAQDLAMFKKTYNSNRTAQQAIDKKQLDLLCVLSVQLVGPSAVKEYCTDLNKN